MRTKTITFQDLLSHYSLIFKSDQWAVAQKRNSSRYDIFYHENGRYEYLISEVKDTDNEVVKIIFTKVGLY